MLASHLTFSAYGFWLPNDPRGSGSKSVGSWDLFAHGGATLLDDRTVPVSNAPHDHARRLAARQALKFPPVVWTGTQAVVIAQGFGIAAEESGYRIWALAILPDHVHLVVAAHAHAPRQIAGHLKGRATQSLRRECQWPADRPVWGARSWASYLDTPEAVAAAVEYVQQNPMKAGLKPQHWTLVTPADL